VSELLSSLDFGLYIQGALSSLGAFKSDFSLIVLKGGESRVKTRVRNLPN
jgi:hypothetical protein